MDTNNTPVAGDNTPKSPSASGYVLVIVAICATAFGLWQRYKFDVRAAKMRHAEVFDWMGLFLDGMTVLVPVFFCWFLMQLISLAFYCSAWKRAGLYAGLVF